MSNRNRSRDNDIEFDINIVPIIDCFTILVTFMLASGVYISIASLEVGIAASGESTEQVQAKDNIAINIDLKTDKSMVIEVSGAAYQTIRLDSIDGNWDFDLLGDRLTTVRDRYPATTSATLVAGPSTPYQDVIRAMEISKQTHPEILLGGF